MISCKREGGKGQWNIFHYEKFRKNRLIIFFLNAIFFIEIQKYPGEIQV